MDIANVCLGRIAVTSIEPVINEGASPTGEASPATGATAAPGPTRVDRVRRRMGRLVALIVLALLVWFALAASIAVRTRPVSASSATRFVPADGLGYQARLAFRGGEGPAGVEHTLLAGLPVTFAMSTTALLALDEPAEGLRKASWWREGVLSGDPTVPSRYRLRSIGPEGVFLRVQDWDTLGLSFEHFLELPADVGVGRRWSSSGRALGQPPDSPLRYRNNSLASTPAEADQAAAGCLEVSSATELSSPAGSEEWRETNLWCPGRGVVSSTGRLRGVAYAITETDRNPPLSTEELQARPFPTTGLDHWVTRRPEIIGGDATFGTEEPYLDSSGPVRATGNQMVVFPFASTSDLMGLIPLTSGQLWAHWWARPGGSVVATTTIGSVVVASTTQRRLVASTAGGRRRWSLQLDDVAAAPPQPIGDRALAVATVGGRLHRVDATNGRVVWSRRLPAGVRAGVAANRDLIVTADTSPAVTGWEADTGRKLWSVEGSPLGTRVALDAAGVYTVSGGSVVARDARTGAERWRRYAGLGEHQVARTGRLLLVRSPAGIDAWSPTDGTRQWTLPEADLGGAGDGGCLPPPGPEGSGPAFLLRGNNLIAMDGAGQVLRTWPMSAPATDRRQLSCTADRVWVFGRDPDRGLTVEWVGPQ